jgi:4a-hydroxytetrahydrobiopterin dehydratase
MELSNKSCVACNSNIPPLNENEANELAKQTPDWKLKFDDGKPEKIKRAFKFKNFRSALEFVNKVGEIAEAEKHHPDIKLGWGYVKISIQTHNINGLHENDFILAAKIDKI